MDSFIQRHKDDVIGTLSGFDRVRIRGTIRWLASIRGLASFLACTSVLLKDFKAYRCWGALRNVPQGPMTSHSGKSSDGRTVEFIEIEVKEKVTHAVDNKEFLLIPQISSLAGAGEARSAMIAPIMDPTGCFGVLYVDNQTDDGPYALSDLDYLMLLAIHTAAIIENF